MGAGLKPARIVPEAGLIKEVKHLSNIRSPACNPTAAASPRGRDQPGLKDQQFDGADNTFPHFLEETDWKKIKIGQRVEAVFEETRRGHLLDIKHFRLVKE